jgi:hypothetical protein
MFFDILLKINYRYYSSVSGVFFIYFLNVILATLSDQSIADASSSNQGSLAIGEGSDRLTSPLR